MDEVQPSSCNEEYNPQGYRRLANIMSEDKHIAIFRRFDEVNIVLLMALQAEIVELQRQFQSKSKEDDEKGLPYSSNFHALRQSAHGKIVQGDNEGCVSKDDQSGLLKSLGSKMIEYSKSQSYLRYFQYISLTVQIPYFSKAGFLSHPSGIAFDMLTLGTKPRNCPNYQHLKLRS